MQTKARMKFIILIQLVVFIEHYQYAFAKSKILCETPQKPKYGDVTIISSDAGSIALYTCDQGRIASGPTRSRCLDNGMWVFPPPECLRQSCSVYDLLSSVPPNIEPVLNKGNSDSFKYNSTVNLTCNYGMILEGNPVAKCDRNGRWNISSIRCEAGCRPPTISPHVNIMLHPEKSFYRFGDTVELSCPNGMKLSEELQLVMCLMTGWSTEDFPICIDDNYNDYYEETVDNEDENGCKLPTNSPDANIAIHPEKNIYKLGEYVVLSCPLGMKLSKEPQTIICLTSGWLPKDFPKCIPDKKDDDYDDDLFDRGENGCKPPTNSPHSNIMLHPEKIFYNFGESVVLSCPFGMKLSKGPQKIMCIMTGWSPNNFPNCIDASSECQESQFRCNDGQCIDISLKCNRRYDCRDGSDELNCEVAMCERNQFRCSSGECIDGNLKCDRKYDCPDGSDELFCTSYECRVPRIDNGRLTEVTTNRLFSWRRLRYEEHIYYKTIPEGDFISNTKNLSLYCDESYAVQGTDTIVPVKCLKGKWSPDLVCDVVKCPVINDPEDLFNINYENDRKLNSYSYYLCKNKTQMTVGSRLRKCLNSGEWSGTAPSCTKKVKGNSTDVKCPKLNDLNGKFYIMYSHGLKVGSTAIYTCRDKRKILSGRSNRTCSSARRWNGIRPSCTDESISTTSTQIPLWITPTGNFHERSTTQTSIYDEYDRRFGTVSTPSAEQPEEGCFCKYPLDDRNIVAQVDGIRLKQGDKVKNGKTVVFRCLYVGFHQFRGPREMHCSECQGWHESDFPSCSNPKKGNTVIIFDQEHEILVDGTVQLQEGKNANFTCIAMETAAFPEWRIPDDVPNISYDNKIFERLEYGEVLYISHLFINNVDYDDEGIYECYVKGYPETSIYIKVIDPDLRCSEIEEEDGLGIEYDMERQVRSKVHFTCPPKRVLIGKPELTCLETGEWSDDPPSCSDILCPEIRDDVLVINYDMERQVRSKVHFSCPSNRGLIGKPELTCLETGEWSDSSPRCSEAPSGCVLEKNPNSHLRIQPAKNRYHFGDFILLSCPPWEELTTGVRRLMCLGGKWSDSLPDCKELI